MKKLISILLLSTCLHVTGQQQSSMLMPVERPGIGFQFVNINNNVPVNNLTWDEAEPFENGFSRVLKGDKFTFVNGRGLAISQPVFDAARNFSNHLAAVEKNGKWGYLNETGTLVIPCQYEIVYDFAENITAVFSNKKWKLINQQGVILHTPDIDVCFGFENGTARVEKHGQTGLMNVNGQISFTGTVNVPLVQRPTNAAINNAAADCPENIDFEAGSFLNWRCYTGSVDSVGNTNVITVTPSAPTVNRHTIINRTIPSAIDPFGLFPINPPDGSNFALKLGNSRIGAQAERVQYTIRVPVNDSNFSIKYDYAVVFQDPGHTTWTQPRFIARLFDSAANAYVNCASFEYISTSNLPGFATSTVDTAVIYKPWSSVFISLRGYAGKTMYLEFTTADCVRRGHWGYAYVDVESTCGQSVTMQYDCNDPNSATFNAPPGFQTYNWWNQNFTTSLGSGQHLVLTPGPPVNSTVWVEMIPFNDFGCRDTLPVRITGSFTPDFDASDTVAVCAPHRFTFYNRTMPSTLASWNFGDGNTATGDTVTHVFNLPGTYIVTLTVTLPSGCVGITQDTVRIIQPTASFSYNPGFYCNSRRVRFDAATTNADSLIWNFGDGNSLTTNQTTVFHTYTTAGIFVPSLTVHVNGGCNLTVPGPDTIKIEQLLAGFYTREQRNCNSTIISFIDSSSSFFGITNYAWNYGDGSTGSGSSSTHTYTTAGTYNVQLIITGLGGCKDTIIHPVNIVINATPVITISGPVQACVQSQLTFSSIIQSADSISTITWSVSDGTSGTGNDLSVSFDHAGTFQIQAIATTIYGCTDTATYQVTILPVPVITTPADHIYCNGTQTNAINFTSSLPNATFNWANDFPGIGLPANGTGNIPAFTATNNGSGQEIANITVTASSNGCPGTPATFTITVNPTPAIAQQNNQTVCNGGTTTGVIFTSFTNAAIASSVINWTNDQPSIGLPASGTGNIPPFTAINNTTSPVTANITITISENGCTGNPMSFTITVQPTPDMGQPSNQELCNGAASDAISFSSASASVVYTWTNDQPLIGLGASGTGNIPVFTAVNNSNASLTGTVTIIPSINGCNGITKYLTITVNPTPDVVQPVNQSLCNGSSTNAILFSGSVNNTTYSWTNNLPSIGLMASGTGDIPSFNPVNNDLVSNTATISVIPSINNCNGTPKDFTITILPRANVTQPLNQFLCNGQASTAMTFTGPLNGTTYNWTNSDTSIGLAQNGNGNIPSFIAVNNSNAAISATISVTATANNCPGNTKTFIITVDPTPDMAQPANQTICNGVLTDAVNFTGTVSGTTYGWINSNPGIGLPASGSGNIPAFIASNTNHYPVTATISVLGTANSCNSVTKVFTITVNPSPDIDPLFDQAVCDGAITDTIELTGPVIGTAFSWTNNKPSIGLPASGTGDIPSFTAINTSAVPVVATINVHGSTASTCLPAIKTFKITVHPTPAVRANTDAVICKGSDMQLTVTGASNYNWSPSTSLSCNNCPNPVASPDDTTRYFVEGISINGCRALDTVLVSVIQPFDMIVSPNDTICSGRSVNLKAMRASRYLWSPPAGLNSTDIADPVATPQASTTYQVIGYDEHHCFTDTGYVNITVGPNPALNIGPDITASTGTTVTFNPTTQNGPITSWSWTPSASLSCTDCPNPSVTVTNNASYVLRIQNSYGCIVQDTITIITFCKNSQVFVPNAFTPDGDGLNDILMIRGTGITVKSFRVFNRWGNVVFEKQNFSPNEPRFGWDGKVRGVPATPDVYVYTAEVTCDNGVVYTYKGNTTILK